MHLRIHDVVGAESVTQDRLHDFAQVGVDEVEGHFAGWRPHDGPSYWSATADEGIGARVDATRDSLPHGGVFVDRLPRRGAAGFRWQVLLRGGRG